MDMSLNEEIKSATFKTSSFSTDNGDCVSVAELSGGRRAVKDSKNPNGAVLVFTPSEWSAFKSGVINNEF